ncbi:MAG: NAD(P)H-nitrite reductase large subunit [Flammeovirgaceae bacterium]|jgi:NAD(P)H-nitrite reductase large subunit
MHIAIIGNGIAGITAARHIRKLSDHRISVISGETDHFFSRTALMYIYMGHMKFKHTKPYEDGFWKKNRIDLVRKWVETVDFEQKKLNYSDGSSVSYDKLILATGSTPNKFGWPGQDLEGVGGMYSYQDLEYLEKHSEGLKHAVVVGGGLIGIELAEMLHSRHIPTSFLVRDDSFWNGVLPKGESEMVNREIIKNKIDLQLETELKEILSDENGKVRAVITSKGEEIPCQYVGLTAGVRPNIDFLKGTELKIERGILVNKFLETNIPDVYAIGDCAQHTDPSEGRRPIEAVWYVGRMTGEVVAQNVCGNKMPYTPGPWFNSAKFIDIEYQTYGIVLAKNPEGQESLYWENDKGNKCIHIVYETTTDQIKGVNVFGTRHRHEVWDKWLKEKRTMDYVLTNLAEANFDPEFFKTYEGEAVAEYNRQNPDKQVVFKKKKRFLELFGM